MSDVKTLTYTEFVQTVKQHHRKMLNKEIVGNACYGVKCNICPFFGMMMCAQAVYDIAKERMTVELLERI